MVYIYLRINSKFDRIGCCYIDYFNEKLFIIRSVNFKRLSEDMLLILKVRKLLNLCPCKFFLKED